MKRDISIWPPELDALLAVPANHRFLLEDSSIRVLEMSIKPGERENLHCHRWPSIMVILARPPFVFFGANGDVSGHRPLRNWRLMAHDETSRARLGRVM